MAYGVFGEIMRTKPLTSGLILVKRVSSGLVPCYCLENGKGIKKKTKKEEKEKEKETNTRNEQQQQPTNQSTNQPVASPQEPREGARFVNLAVKQKAVYQPTLQHRRWLEMQWMAANTGNKS
ncbi:hypothetical protein BGW42_006038 [Actinomortierella wolfii]|nr:hypothetical protein BGW42_006038 [Actinomortierella wolfii]